MPKPRPGVYWREADLGPTSPLLDVASKFTKPAGALTSPIEWHRRLGAYTATPLVDARGVAERLGVKHVWVKDESERFGLPSYKVLGASWAVYRSLIDRLGDPGDWDDLNEFKAWLGQHPKVCLVAATDGNHGRAVASMARRLGLNARILVPQNMVPARIRAIEGEGATVTVVSGSYDDAVAQSAEDLDANDLLVSDTSWPGYDVVPRWVTDGYQTVFDEVDAQLAARDASPPDLVMAQVGVGALAAAVARHFGSSGAVRAKIATVEPDDAACLLESLRARSITEVPGPHNSIMAGLNCGLPSLICWPVLREAVDFALSVDDALAIRAMGMLDEAGVVSGESGAAGLAGLLRMAEDGYLADPRLGVTDESSILVINTEGLTGE